MLTVAAGIILVTLFLVALPYLLGIAFPYLIVLSAISIEIVCGLGRFIAGIGPRRPLGTETSLPAHPTDLASERGSRSL